MIVLHVTLAIILIIFVLHLIEYIIGLIVTRGAIKNVNEYYIDQDYAIDIHNTESVEGNKDDITVDIEVDDGDEPEATLEQEPEKKPKRTRKKK